MGAVGQLYARKTLDYEDEMHRRGFRFMVQVTDRGRGGWKDPRHLDSAWVTVKLRDLNDNAPHFSRPHAHITVREDTAPGTLLASLHAHDPDMAGQQKVDYQVSGGWGALTVGADGGVSLWRSLDREAPDGDTGVATVIAVDRGRPPLTSTATLTITVADVNDCAPRLLPPTVLHVTEGTPPTLLGVLTATDYDVWALGHGPPFNFTLSPTNPIHVLTHIKLKFDPHLDSGRGGAELWTSRPADREEHRSLEVQVTIGDAGGVTATHPVTVVIDDLNDNPMKPASKTVYLWKTQGGGGSKAPLGRVYVEDPDDWDLEDKTFQWVGPPHPLFSLNPNDGTIFASSQVREGRYELHFSVSDRAWRQRGVSANVTVAVRLLSQEALAHAAPITLTPTTPTDLTRGWTPTHGGGGLGRLVEGILKAVGEGTHTVEVVSVYGHPHYAPPHYHHHHYYHHHHHPSPHAAHSPPTALEDGTEARQHPPRVADTLPPSACVWVSVRDQRGVFMDPIKLHGLLGLHSRQLEEATSLKVWLESSGITGRRRPEELQSPDLHRDLQRLLHDLKQGEDGDPSSAASLASTALPLQVVDTNATSLVTPRLSRAHACYAHEPESCTPTSCLNGGSCIRLATGNRCVCPGGSKGWQCKVLSRTFSGSGWAWVRPLPPCLPTTISLRVLTWRPNALILYSGPLSPQQRPPESSSSSSSSSSAPRPTPMLALQLKYGRPQLLLEGGIVPLKLEVNTTIHGGDWHTLHVHLDTQGVALMVDLCGQGWENNAQNDVHCLAQADWSAPFGLEEWLGSGPLQVGGIAHSPPTAHDHGWGEAPTARPLQGCVSHLILNGQLVDLGEPAYSQGNTAAGCKPQESACPAGCGVHGECAGGLKRPGCECQPGWGGSGCSTPTVPASLGKSSYVKVALSFTPAPRVLKVQLRVRTRGARHGLLLHLAAHHHSAAFMLHLRSSVVCASLTGSEWAAMAACVEARPLGDGEWHTVQAERHGDNLLVSVDDGDGWRRNESLASFLAARDGGRRREPPSALNVDKHDGVTVGGLPEFVGVKLVGIRDDLVDACVDDLRVSNHPLPLPPAINGTSWGQVTTLQHLERGCEAPDACLNTTCAQPLTCTTTWGQATCSCGPGRQLVDRTCEDIDECVWRPCLHGGSCYNLRPGFLCVCGPGHMGDHCQWTTLASSTNSLTAPVAIAALTASLIVLLVVGLVVSLRLHRHRSSLGLRERGTDVDDTAKGTVVEVKRRSRSGKGADEDEGGGGGGGGLEGEKELREDDTHESFLECLKFKLPSSQPALKKKGKRSSCRSEASPTESADAVVSSGDPSPGAAAAAAPGAAADPEAPPPDPLLPRDDLRAYAYEGDGSSSGSFASTISDLKVEMAEEDSTIVPLVPEFLEVMDLLKNLPEAPKKASFTRKRSASLKTSSSPKEPTPSCIVLGKNSGSCPGDAATSNLESSAPSIILVKGSGSPGCPRDPVTSSLVLGKGGSGSPRFPRDSPVSSIVLVKGSGAAIKPSIRTRLSHLSPSRFKGEGTSKTDVVLAKGESEVSTVC
nr:neural-cadherin-like [Procambarus clarkii]